MNFITQHRVWLCVQDYPNFPDLGPWVRRQRVVQQQGTLSEQRVQILDAIGFDFGNEAQITEEWEMRFDQLVDWLLWKVRLPAAAQVDPSLLCASCSSCQLQ